MGLGVRVNVIPDWVSEIDLGARRLRAVGGRNSRWEVLQVAVDGGGSSR